jgi:hypothetical protein
MTESNQIQSSGYLERFSTYFAREVAEKAASPLAKSAEIEFRAGDPENPEIFTFHRQDGKNGVRPGPASDPQVVFTMTPQAAETILSDPASEIGAIGIGILKLVVSADPSRRVSVKLKAGFLTLWNKGYFGVITAGGAPFASFLASKGLSGLNAIKEALKHLRE